MRVSAHHKRRIIHGNTLFAVTVYWNMLYSGLIFTVVTWVTYFAKVADVVDTVRGVLYTALLVTWMLCEGPRLYMGWHGNRSQSVASLFGFVLMTLLTHLCFLLGLVFIVPGRSALDIAVVSLQLCMGLLEIVVGVVVLRRVVRRNTVYFYVSLGGSAADDGSDSESAHDQEVLLE